MDNGFLYFITILMLNLSILFCKNEISDLKKEIEQIKETNIVCEVEEYEK